MKGIVFYLIFILAFLLFFISCNIEPYGDDLSVEIETPITCSDAIQQTTTAITHFTGATDANYKDLCNAYKKALQDQIAICGDADGSIQSVINGLACENSAQPNNCDQIDIILVSAKVAFDNASDSNYAQLCNNYRSALQLKIITCGDTDESLQAIVDILGNCIPVGNGSTEQGFMTANIDGEQFNDMKPNGYLFFGESVDVNGFFTRNDDDYLIIQGNSGYQIPLTINVTDKEINLNIPSTLWEEGTFDLYNEATDVDSPVIYYTFFIYTEPENYYKNNLMGEITIKKFDLTERFIQGTFEFEYEFVSEIDGSTLGPYKVTGTFDYALDDEFFD